MSASSGGIGRDEGWREMYRRMHAEDGYKADESTVHFPRNEVTYGG